jgi:hypothetical protein
VPARNTEEGIRAVKGTQVIKPDEVLRYLENKFGEHLATVWQAMKQLARSCPQKDLARRAFGLYERFRPKIPEGVKGWGAKGTLAQAA